MEDIKKPKYYKTLIDENNRMYNIVLDELTVYYSIYKMNSDTTEFSDKWDNLNYSMDKVNNNFFMIQNDITNDSNKLKKEIKKINIERLKLKNTELKKKYRQLQSKENASDGLLDEEIDIYKYKIINLFILLGASVGIGYLSAKQF